MEFYITTTIIINYITVMTFFSTWQDWEFGRKPCLIVKKIQLLA